MGHVAVSKRMVSILWFMPDVPDTTNIVENRDDPCKVVEPALAFV